MLSLIRKGHGGWYLMKSNVLQEIIPPDDEWNTYIVKMWLLGNQVSQDVIGVEMDGTLEDLKRLQIIIESKQIPVENTKELQSFGIILGKVFVNETPDYDWWVVNDEHGKDVCIRYKETSLLIFPLTIISKRIEDGELFDVVELYRLLTVDLERIKNENYANV